MYKSCLSKSIKKLNNTCNFLFLTLYIEISFSSNFIEFAITIFWFGIFVKILFRFH